MLRRLQYVTSFENKTLDEDPSFKNAYLVVDDTIIGKNTIISSLIVVTGACACLPVHSNSIPWNKCGV